MNLGLWLLLYVANTAFTWWVVWGGGSSWLEGWRSWLVVDWLFSYSWNHEQIGLYTLICWLVTPFGSQWACSCRRSECRTGSRFAVTAPRAEMAASKASGANALNRPESDGATARFLVLQHERRRRVALGLREVMVFE
jgi:hypothetical protein